MLLNMKYRTPLFLYEKPDDKGGTPPGGKHEEDPEDTGNPGPDDKDKDKSKKLDMTQKQFDEAITKRLEQQQKKFDDALQAVKDAHQKEKDEEAGNYKELYETEKGKAAVLQAKVDASESLTDYVNELIDTEIAEWPEEVQELAPSKDNIQDRIKWLPKGRALVKKLGDNNTAPNNEHGKTPKKEGEIDPLKKAKSAYSRPDKKD